MKNNHTDYHRPKILNKKNTLPGFLHPDKVFQNIKTCKLGVHKQFNISIYFANWSYSKVVNQYIGNIG